MEVVDDEDDFDNDDDDKDSENEKFLNDTSNSKIQKKQSVKEIAN